MFSTTIYILYKRQFASKKLTQSLAEQAIVGGCKEAGNGHMLLMTIGLQCGDSKGAI